MSRYIDTDALEYDTEWSEYHDGFTAYSQMAIDTAPSIDIVRCKECKHGEYREDFNDYECHSSGCGLVYDADFYCADGERKDK